MADKDLRKELELLRQQLDVLERDRGAVGPTIEPESDSPTEQGQRPTLIAEDLLETVSKGEQNLAAQFKELLEELDKDINDTKPTTLLIVFALGVLVGRL